MPLHLTELGPLPIIKQVLRILSCEENMIRKIIILLLIFTLIFIIKCSLPFDDSEGYMVEKYPLCTMNSDGSDYRILIDDFYVDAMTFTNSDSQIVILNYDGISILDLQGNTINNTKINLKNISYPTFSNDGRYLAVVASEKDDNERDIYIMNTDGMNLINLTNNSNVSAQFLAFSNNNDKLVFSVYPTNRDRSSIEIIELSNLNRTVVLEINNDFVLQSGNNPFWYPKFNYNDEKIIFYYDKWNSNTQKYFTELYSINIDTGTLALIDSSAIFIGDIKTTKRADEILYLHSGDETYLYLTDSNGTFFCKPDLPSPYYSMYNLAPEENEFVFAKESRYNDFDDYIFTVNIDLKITKKLRLGASPVYSMDGKKIVFIGYTSTVYK